jgi:hypothetical protein
MLVGLLLFVLCVGAAPFVIIAAVVHVCRKNRADGPTRILD